MPKKKKHGAMKQEKAGVSESRVHESQRYPLKALYVAPTSASSTATTVGLYSPPVYSGHDDDNDDEEEEEEGSEQDAFLLSSVKSSTSTSSSSSSPGHRRASGSGNGPPSYQNGDRTDSTAHRHKHKKHHHPRRFEDLEYGDAKAADNNDEDTSSDKWQVMREFQHCVGGQGFFQVVHLKRSNFGVQWRQKNADASSCEVASAPPTCMVGPHWWLMTTTFTVFTGLALVITVLTAPKAGFGESITGILLSTACLSMYAMVGCSNPGIVPRIDVAPDDTYSFCDHCESYRPQGALHCMDCRVCIEEYDHHCPWTGKCVGKGNVRYFYAWLFFLVLAFVYEVIEFTTYMMPPEDQPDASYSDDFTFAPSAVASPSHP